MSEVSIRMIIDPATALEAGTPHGSLFMFDNRRRAGSLGQRTDHLQTAVAPNDIITWVLLPIECEVYVELEEINIDKEFCEVSSHYYPGTNVRYWTGKVKKAVGDLPYSMTFKVGRRHILMSTDSTARLIDAAKNTSVAGQAKEVA